MDRRCFLSASAGSMLVVSTPFLFATQGCANNKPGIRLSREITSTGLARRQWKTITAVQEHLLPSEEDAPGATDINARAFLYAILSDARRDDEERQRIKDGLLVLQDICWKQYKKTFIALTHEHREDVLRTFEMTLEGSSWLMTVLGYLIEALLTDPIYGGNPEAIGWRWLGHQAGFPRPGADQRYFLL